jgi:hypothetical protein
MGTGLPIDEPEIHLNIPKPVYVMNISNLLYVKHKKADIGIEFVL